MVQYFALWWYMSIFKKVMHIVLDLLVLVVLAFPIYDNMIGAEEDAGRMMMHVVGISLIAIIIVSMLALVPKLIFYIMDKMKEKDGTDTGEGSFPKEPNPYEVKVETKQGLQTKPM